jgi:hypothetical protein
MHALLAQHTAAANSHDMQLSLLPHHVKWLVVYLDNGSILAKPAPE